MRVIVRKIIVRSSIVCLIASLLSFFFFKDYLPVIYGLIFSYLMSVLMFLQMDKSTRKAITMTPDKAENYIRLMYMVRFLIYAVVLTICILADYLDFFAALFGLIIIKYCIVVSSIFDKNFLQSDD